MLIRSRKVYVLAANERQSKGFSFVSSIRQSKKNTMQSVDKMFRIFRPREWIAILMMALPLSFFDFKTSILIGSIIIGMLLLMNWELDKKEDKGFKI